MNTYYIARACRAWNGITDSPDDERPYVVFDHRILLARAAQVCAALDDMPDDVRPCTARYVLEACVWASESSIREWLGADCPPSLAGQGAGRKWRPSQTFTEKNLYDLESQGEPSDIVWSWFDLDPRTEYVRIGCERGVSLDVWYTAPMVFRGNDTVSFHVTDESPKSETVNEVLRQIIEDVTDRKIRELLPKVQSMEAQLAELKRSKT